MTTPNQCRFWNCDEIIRRDYFLCHSHYTGYQEGRIDECPQCYSYKGASYPVCRNCERQPAAPQRGFARPSAGIAEPEARPYQPAATPPGNANYAALLEELRDLRDNLARTHRLQDFMVFNNDTLEQMATIRPTTAEAMQAFSGVGPVKMERFGWGFLRVIRKYVNPPQISVQTTGARAGVQPDAVANRPQTPVQLAEPPADDPRQRWLAPYRTDDGHYVRSRGEAMVDNWLYNHRIVHSYERKLPVAENALSDFYLPQGPVYIEYWGREEYADYAQRMREKQEIYQRNNLQLISLTDTEINSLDDHLPQQLIRFGIRPA